MKQTKVQRPEIAEPLFIIVSPQKSHDIDIHEIVKKEVWNVIKQGCFYPFKLFWEIIRTIGPVIVLLNTLYEKLLH